MKKLLAYLLAIIISVLNLALPLGQATAAGANLVGNPSVETAATATAPQGWLQSKWGTNNATFAYQSTGQEGRRSLKVSMTSRTSGDAKWYYQPVAVTAGTKYTYSHHYKSNVATEVDALVTDTTGKQTWVWLSTTPASATWKQATGSFTAPANAKAVTIMQILGRAGTLETDNYSLFNASAPAPTTPVVAMTSPAGGSTVSGTQSVAASASDSTGIAGVQFKLDGANLGAEDTTAPYSMAWDTTKASNGSHALTAVARSTAGVTAVSSATNVTVSNVATPPANPTVSLSSPSGGATVSGSQNVAANASHGNGIAGVQFKLDGANLGAEDTTAPYTVSWDTKTAANGSHALTAVARSTVGTTATSAPVNVTVSNTVTPPPATTNLIQNASFETANGAAPASWTGNGWGTNTRSLTYLNTGRTGAHSVKTQITAYTSGDAKWMHASVPVTAGQTYQFADYYQSNIASELNAAITLSNGSVQYLWLGDVPASSTWSRTAGQFTAPAGAVSVSVFHVIAGVGFLVTDDHSLTAYKPGAFNRALVSLTFDDGWRNIYSNGLPIMQKYGFTSTQYLLTGTTTYPDYMTVDMMKQFYAAGHEIAAHTVSHADLATLNTTQMDAELQQSKAALEQWIGVPVTNFATPYGSYNDTVVGEIKKYYGSHRSTQEGFNSRDNLNIWDIKVQNIRTTTTPAEVSSWIEQAKRDNTWLVLVYHQVTPSPAAGDNYAVTPANLDAELQALKNSGLAVVTVQQALNELLPQL